ncbi:MAG: DUF4911 domain-containing protein [Desulfobacterales bacterium]
MKTLKQNYRVDRREIAFLKFILEAYDGIATLRTEDAIRGIITFHIAPGCERQFAEILKDLKKDIMIEPLGLKLPKHN